MITCVYFTQELVSLVVPEHGQALTAQTISQMVDKVLALEEGTKVMLLAPIVQDRKGEHVKLLDNLALKVLFAHVLMGRFVIYPILQR